MSFHLNYAGFYLCFRRARALFAEGLFQHFQTFFLSLSVPATFLSPCHEFIFSVAVEHDTGAFTTSWPDQRLVELKESPYTATF